MRPAVKNGEASNTCCPNGVEKAYDMVKLWGIQILHATNEVSRLRFRVVVAVVGDRSGKCLLFRRVRNSTHMLPGAWWLVQADSGGTCFK
jgi:hypothetical protein